MGEFRRVGHGEDLGALGIAQAVRRRAFVPDSKAGIGADVVAVAPRLKRPRSAPGPWNAPMFTQNLPGGGDIYPDRGGRWPECWCVTFFG